MRDVRDLVTNRLKLSIQTLVGGPADSQVRGKVGTVHLFRILDGIGM